MKLRLGWLAALLACCAITMPASAFHGEDVSTADYGRVLRLDDHTGARRSLVDFRGRVVLLFFGFTYCPDICPTELLRLAELRRILGQDAHGIQVLFVTLDPERDSAESLASYVTGFDPSFIALRGSREETDAAAREFKVFHHRIKGSAPDRYTIDHSAYIYAIDTNGSLRLRFDGTAKLGEMAEDIRALLAGR